MCVYIDVYISYVCMYVMDRNENSFHSCRMECAIFFLKKNALNLFLHTHMDNMDNIVHVNVQGRERARACILSLFVPMYVFKYVQYLSDSFFFVKICCISFCLCVYVCVYVCVYICVLQL
jgi:hypothetical protein